MKTKSKKRKQPTLTSKQLSRAETLAEQLTVFADFRALLAYYHDHPIGYRGENCKMAAAGLMAQWSEAEREMERQEHALQLELAYLIELALGTAGPTRIVVWPVKLAS